MKTKVYILFQTNIYKSTSSRICFGVFSSEVEAIDSAKENELYHHTAEVDIIECELDKFEEI